MRRIGYAAALISLTSAVIGSGAVARAAYPGGDGRIAYGRIAYVHNFGPARVVTVDPDGQSGRVVTPANWRAATPAWSADGSQLAYVRSRRDGSGDALMTANADGSNVFTVVPFSPVRNRAIVSLTWSPDSSTIAFCVTRTFFTFALYTIGAEGMGGIRITTGDHSDCDPAWSPDGTTIAFDTEIGHARAHAIAIMNPDGSGRSNVVTSGYSYSPDWSPDGSHLTFEHAVPHGTSSKYDIFTVRADDGTELTNITASPHRSEETPAYSPSGTRIVYSREQSAIAFLEDLWVRNADGSGRPQRLTDTPHRDEFHPSWQPT